MNPKRYCICGNEIASPTMNRTVEITAKEPLHRDNQWMANNAIKIEGNISKLLAVRICNQILKHVGIEFAIDALPYWKGN